MIKLLLDLEWVTRLTQFKQLLVGFSGGLDSTVLLHVLAACPPLVHRLTAVHINHGLSPNAPHWQNHCEQVCINLGLDFIAHAVTFNKTANVEEEARIARYAVFSSLLKEEACLVLAHHRDDQAETLLLHLFRGAGIDGLAAMSETVILGLGTIVRPLLSLSRKQLEQYALEHELNWLEDESNQDIKYSRNYLRHHIMPLLQERWPGVASNIAKTSNHCLHAKTHLEELALHDASELISPKKSLSIEPLKALSVPRIINVVRVWLKKNEIRSPSKATLERVVHEVIFAGVDTTPVVSWGRVQVRRYRHHLFLDELKSRPLTSAPCIEWVNFPSALVLKEYNIHLIAESANQGLTVPQNAKVAVRFRQGGKRFYWHGQNKSLKKLFQEWNIPPWERETVPLIYLDEILAAVVGYAVSDLFYSSDGPCWQLSTLR